MRAPVAPVPAFVAVLEETVAAWAAGRVTCSVVLPVEQLVAFNASIGLPAAVRDRGRPDAVCRLVLLPIYGPSDPAGDDEVAIAASADALVHLLERGSPIPPSLRARLTRVAAAAIEATMDPERSLIRTEPA